MLSPWPQNYDPLGNPVLSTVVAAIPVGTLFYFLVRRAPAYKAALYALAAAAAIALAVFRMPAFMVGEAVAGGMVFATFRMIWTLTAAVFVYNVTVESGHFEIIKQSIGSITDDRRLQAILIAIAFSALLEGASGGGAPVSICASMMVGLGFPPLQAVLLCLIGNSVPVANGGMGNPVRVLVAVTGLAEPDLNGTLGRILPWISLILPFWLVGFQASARAVAGVWPGLLACGIFFGGIQFAWSNFVDNSLVSIVGGMGTLVGLVAFLRWWQPKTMWRYPSDSPVKPGAAMKHSTRRILHAWFPFLLLTVLVVAWGLPGISDFVNAATLRIPAPHLHMGVVRRPPVVVKAYAEPAVFEFAWLQAVGSATFFAGLLSGPIQGLSMRHTLQVFFRTVYRMRLSIVAVLAMVGLGYLTRYSGMDAILGLAMAHTGFMFPMFGTLIGWLGVALTGTAAGSNALFGSLQSITAGTLGISAVLMAAANCAGGVMGKMIAAQSVVVGCAATGQDGKEGDVFRAALKHSLLLALIVSLIVTVYAYVAPWMVASGLRY